MRLPRGLPKLHYFWFALTHPALSQEAQSTLPPSPNKGSCLCLSASAMASPGSPLGPGPVSHQLLYVNVSLVLLELTIWHPVCYFSSVQFSRSVVSNSLRPHESQHARPPIHHQLPEFTQTCVHRVSDAIQPSHPLSSPSPPAPSPSQY